MNHRRLNFLRDTFDKTYTHAASAILRIRTISKLLTPPYEGTDPASHADLVLELKNRKRVVHKIATKIAARRMKESIHISNLDESSN